MNNGFYQSNQIDHLYPVVVAYYYKEWKNFQMPFHTHEAIEIMYVISGECHVQVGDEMLAMKNGHFIMIDTQVPHRLIVAADQTCRMLNIEFILEPKEGIYPSIKEMAEEDSRLASFLQREKLFTVLKDTEGLYYTLKSLVTELSNRAGKRPTIVIKTLLSHVLLLVARMEAVAEEQVASPADIYIKQVLEYIQHNYDRDLTVAELAANVYLHPNYLHRIFKESMHCTITEYLTELRIEKAKMLLAKTTIPITEISDFVGINSRQYFSYLFKKRIGETPRDYRKRIIESP